MAVLRLANFRCVESLDLELRPLTILVGRNAVGKSSVALAPYFLAKAAEWGDANAVALHLFGVQLGGLVRAGPGGERFYPMVVEVDGARLEAGPGGVSVPKSAPWVSAYLLPSQRLSFVRVPLFLARAGRELLRDVERALAFLVLRGSWRCLGLCR